MASEFGRLSVEVRASLILTARSFLEMFTSYSHRLPVRPASGREIRNRCRNRQEKNSNLFFVATKKILTENQTERGPNNKIDSPRAQ